MLCSSCSLCFRFCQLPTLPLAPLSPCLPCSWHPCWAFSRWPCSSPQGTAGCGSGAGLLLTPAVPALLVARPCAQPGHRGAAAALIHRAVTQTAHTHTAAGQAERHCFRNQLCIPAPGCCQGGVKNSHTHTHKVILLFSVPAPLALMLSRDTSGEGSAHLCCMGLAPRLSEELRWTLQFPLQTHRFWQKVSAGVTILPNFKAQLQSVVSQLFNKVIGYLV